MFLMSELLGGKKRSKGRGKQGEGDRRKGKRQVTGGRLIEKRERKGEARGKKCCMESREERGKKPTQFPLPSFSFSSSTFEKNERKLYLSPCTMRMITLLQFIISSGKFCNSRVKYCH